jgi:uncharacterized protein (TIGR03437 family)
MRVNRIVSLMFALASVVTAQVGTVQNAALYQPTLLFANLQGIVNSGAVSAYVDLPVSFPANSANIIAPRMLAVLSYPAVETIAIVGLQNTAPTAVPVTAMLWIRSVGSSTATPLTVTNAATGAITFVVPSSIPLGGAELLYQIDDQPTQWTNVNVVQSSFEFFRISSGGPAIAQTAAAEGAFSNVGLATPAQPGQTVLLTGSGLGYGSTVGATIGGVSAPVVYAGAYPAQVGKDEVLLQIPSGIPDGCYVPVTFTYNQTTVSTTISKTSDGSPCKHPWQLSVSDMKTLDNGGTLTDGAINLSTQLSAVTSTVASRNESANMNLGQITAGGIAAYFTPTPATSDPGCTALTPSVGLSPAFLNGSFSVLLPLPTLPDIGASVTLQSPTTAITLTGVIDTGLYSQALPPPTDGPLSNPPPPVIAGGIWTWQSSGGRDLPASSFGFTLPAPIQLNGGAPISLRLGLDQTITWNGTAFDAGATVSVIINGTAALVTCTVPASKGMVTIPASLLSGYTANTRGTLTANLNESGFFLPHAQFQLKNGSTLLMFVSFFSNDSRPVDFQ